MFWTKEKECKCSIEKADLECSVAELEDDKKTLEEKVIELTKEVDLLEHKKKLEEEDIKHMVKMQREALELEYQKKEVAKDKECQETVAKAKDEYRDKLEEFLTAKAKDIKEMYNEILQRLPSVNVNLGDKKVE